MVRQLRCGTVRMVKLGCGTLGQLRPGLSRCGQVRLARLGKLRQLRLVGACFGMVSCGMAVMVSHGRCGTFRYGLLWQLRYAGVGHV